MPLSINAFPVDNHTQCIGTTPLHTKPHITEDLVPFHHNKAQFSTQYQLHAQRHSHNRVKRNKS